MKKAIKILICSIIFVGVGALASCSVNPDPTPSTCVHVDKDNNHVCDLCGYVMSNHTDFNNDHKCDLCETVISQHIDDDKNHKCDICTLQLSDHTDTNTDHICDYCLSTISVCFDDDKNHICDYCGKVMSECTDDNHDHYCDCCEKKLSDCVDDNPKDHCCDICEVKLSDCVDADFDYYCDYCGEEIVPTKQHPRIVTNETSPAFSYLKGTDLALADESETLYYIDLNNVKIGFEFFISTYETKYRNWLKTSTEQNDAYYTTCFSLTSAGNAHFNVNGNFTVYFETEGTNAGISVVANDVSSNYKFVETVGSITDWCYLGFAYETGEHSRTTYEIANQIFATNEWVQIKKGSVLQRFTFDTNISSSKYVYCDDGNSNSVQFLTKIDTKCRVKLFVSTTNQSITLSIRYES